MAWAEMMGRTLRMARPRSQRISATGLRTDGSRCSLSPMSPGAWATRAREASSVINAKGDEDEIARGPMLLAGIRRALNGRQAISTADLLEAINADDELPFGGWNQGDGMKPRDVAKMLRPYKVRPKSIREGDMTAKGYALRTFKTPSLATCGSRYKGHKGHTAKHRHRQKDGKWPMCRMCRT